MKTHIFRICVYVLIEEKYGIPVIRAEEIVMAEASDALTADKLKIGLSGLVVVLNRLTYSTDSKIIEVQTGKGRADMFSYKRGIR